MIGFTVSTLASPGEWRTVFLNRVIAHRQYGYIDRVSGRIVYIEYGDRYLELSLDDGTQRSLAIEFDMIKDIV